MRLFKLPSNELDDNIIADHLREIGFQGRIGRYQRNLEGGFIQVVEMHRSKPFDNRIQHFNIHYGLAHPEMPDVFGNKIDTTTTKHSMCFIRKWCILHSHNIYKKKHLSPFFEIFYDDFKEKVLPFLNKYQFIENIGTYRQYLKKDPNHLKSNVYIFEHKEIKEEVGEFIVIRQEPEIYVGSVIVTDNPLNTFIYDKDMNLITDVNTITSNSGDNRTFMVTNTRMKDENNMEIATWTFIFTVDIKSWKIVDTRINR